MAEQGEPSDVHPRSVASPHVLGALGGAFSTAGYEVLAPGWPGDMPTVEEARANPGSVANRGIDDIVAHHAEIIDGLRAQPILVGHSFGGMFAEKLLGDGKGAAAVAIDSAQIKGVLALPCTIAGTPWPGRPSGTRPPGEQFGDADSRSSSSLESFGNLRGER